MAMRWRSRTAVAAGAVAALVMSMSSPATAEKTRNGSAGRTVISLTNQVAKEILGGCGAGVTTAPSGDAQMRVSDHQVKFELPVTALVTTDTGNIRIAHAGSGFVVSNSCHEVRFAGFYVQDLGDGTSASGFEVLARDFNDVDGDGKPRETTFSLDLTNANVTVTGNSTKVRAANLQLSSGGAIEFNRLAGDPTGASGPFSAGDRLGNTRSFYRNPA